MENITVDMKVEPERRRIDDLGRVVIPKRIREMLKIDEGDVLEECVVNVEGESSYGVLITPMRENNPEERLLKKLLPYMRILTQYVPAECRVAYVTADGTPKISYFELGYSPNTSLKSLYADDEYRDVVIPFLQNARKQYSGRRVDIFAPPRGNAYLFSRITMKGKLVGYAAAASTGDNADKLKDVSCIFDSNARIISQLLSEITL